MRGMSWLRDATAVAAPRRAGPAKLRRRLGNCANGMLGFVHDARTTYPPFPATGPADRRGASCWDSSDRSGTFDLMPTAPRLAYWLAVISVNWLPGRCRPAAAWIRWRASGCRCHDSWCPLIGACLAAVPATGAFGGRWRTGFRGSDGPIMSAVPVRAGAAAARSHLPAGLHMGGHAGADRGHARLPQRPKTPLQGASLKRCEVPAEGRGRPVALRGAPVRAARGAAPLPRDAGPLS